jgi:hypothetical protein
MIETVDTSSSDPRWGDGSPGSRSKAYLKVSDKNDHSRRALKNNVPL